MSKLLARTTVLVVAIGFAFTSSAAVLFDGNGDPTASGFQAINGAPTGWSFDTESGVAMPGILYQDTVTLGNTGGYKLADATSATELVRANGWYIETRIQTIQNTGDFFGAFLLAEDEVGGAGALLRTDRIDFYTRDFATYAIPNLSQSIGAGYHTVGMQMPAGGTNFNLFVDGSLVGSIAGNTQGAGIPNVNIGDGSSGSNAQVNWDYISVNSIAPPAPPDPIPLDATFDPGASPSDFGWSAAGNVSPSSNVAGGVWTSNLSAGQSSAWSGGPAAVADLTGSVIHGYADIDVETFATGSNDDATLIAFGRDANNSATNLGMIAYFLDGSYSLHNGLSVTGVPVANQDGLQHRYGWEVDLSARTVKLFFDDNQVGAPSYSIGNNTFVGAPDASNDSFFYFGDASGGGAHHEIWDQAIVHEGFYPLAPGTGIDLNATFDSGALPSDFGWNAAGSVDPSANVAGGVWTQNRAPGESSVWVGGKPAANTIIPGSVWHGWADVRVVDIGDDNPDDKTAFGMFRHTDLVGSGNEYGFLAYFRDGAFQFLSTGFNDTIAVDNIDGEFHRYGWEVDESTRMLKLFFDDALIASGIMTGNFAGESGTYFGDASGGGAHNDEWTWVFAAQGAYPVIPEPGSMLLLATGIIGLGHIGRRNRRR